MLKLPKPWATSSDGRALRSHRRGQRFESSVAHNSLMNQIKLLLILSLLSIIPGQIIRLPIAGLVVLTVSDIIVPITLLASTVYLLAVKKSIRLSPKIIIPAAIFLLTAAASTILALNAFSPKEVAISSMFLARFLLYLSLSVITANMIPKNDLTKWLKLFLTIGVILAVLGYLQLLLFSDLSRLTAYGWDPHQTRLVSTFLDPNFAGGFLTLVFSFSLSLFLKEKKGVYFIFSLVIFAAILLTFSRSSYLAALTVLAIIGFAKSPRLLIGFLAIALVAFLLVPQIRARVIGAATLDETSKARFESWQNAITIFKDNPIMGVGFNTYRFAQARAGFFSFDSPMGGHSGAGSDSSILLVAATTGVIGLSAYIFLLYTIARVFLKSANDVLHLAAFSAFIGLLIHSQFVNSLFFPQIMLPFWFILGLVTSHDS